MGSIRYHHGMSVQTQNSPKLVNPRKAQNGADFCVVGGGIAVVGYVVVFCPQVRTDVARGRRVARAGER